MCPGVREASSVEGDGFVNSDMAVLALHAFWGKQ